MARCAYCDSEMEKEIEEPEEINCRGGDSCRCRACREILGIISKEPKRSRKGQIKVPIQSSDYHLPGFVLAEDKKSYVRKKKK